MRYVRPFSPDQRREAALMYRSYRRNYRLLRTTYPPASPKERQLLREYQRYIQTFGREAVKHTRDIHPELLNDLESRANFVLAEYFSEKLNG